MLGKQNVGIKAVEPVGQYAVKLVFDDGHDSGLYSWKYLRELGDNHAGELGEVPGAGAERPNEIKGRRSLRLPALSKTPARIVGLCSECTTEKPALSRAASATRLYWPPCDRSQKERRDRFRLRTRAVERKAAPCARRVRLGRRQLRPDERPDVRRRASPLEGVHAVADAACVPASARSTSPAAPAT